MIRFSDCPEIKQPSGKGEPFGCGRLIRLLHFVDFNQGNASATAQAGHLRRVVARREGDEED